MAPCFAFDSLSSRGDTGGMPLISRRSLLAAWLAAPSLAGAQGAWRPTRPVTIVVPFTPGGSTDFLARLLGQSITDALGVGVVVENRPGAGGGIASGAVAKAAPDGQTLLLGHIGTLAVNPWLYANLPYDPVRSFAPVSLLATVHNVLAVHPSVAARGVGPDRAGKGRRPAASTTARAASARPPTSPPPPSRSRPASASSTCPIAVRGRR